MINRANGELFEFTWSLFDDRLALGAAGGHEGDQPGTDPRGAVGSQNRTRPDRSPGERRADGNGGPDGGSSTGRAIHVQGPAERGDPIAYPSEARTRWVGPAESVVRDDERQHVARPSLRSTVHASRVRVFARVGQRPRRRRNRRSPRRRPGGCRPRSSSSRGARPRRPAPRGRPRGLAPSAPPGRPRGRRPAARRPLRAPPLGGRPVLIARRPRAASSSTIVADAAQPRQCARQRGVARRHRRWSSAAVRRRRWEASSSRTCASISPRRRAFSTASRAAAATAPASSSSSMTRRVVDDDADDLRPLAHRHHGPVRPVRREVDRRGRPRPRSRRPAVHSRPPAIGSPRTVARRSRSVPPAPRSKLHHESRRRPARPGAPSGRRA